MAKNNKTNHLSPRLAKDYEGVYHAHGQQPLTSSIPIIAHGYLNSHYDIFNKKRMWWNVMAFQMLPQNSSYRVE